MKYPANIFTALALVAAFAIGGTIRCERDDEDDKSQRAAIQEVVSELPGQLMPAPEMQMGRKGYTCKGKIMPLDRGDGGVEYTHTCKPN